MVAPSDGGTSDTSFVVPRLRGSGSGEQRVTRANSLVTFSRRASAARIAKLSHGFHVPEHAIEATAPPCPTKADPRQTPLARTPPDPAAILPAPARAVAAEPRTSHAAPTRESTASTPCGSTFPAAVPSCQPAPNARLASSTRFSAPNATLTDTPAGQSAKTWLLTFSPPPEKLAPCSEIQKTNSPSPASCPPKHQRRRRKRSVPATRTKANSYQFIPAVITLALIAVALGRGIGSVTKQGYNRRRMDEDQD
jgi:hypothetical protein